MCVCIWNISLGSQFNFGTTTLNLWTVDKKKINSTFFFWWRMLFYFLVSIDMIGMNYHLKWLVFESVFGLLFRLLFGLVFELLFGLLFGLVSLIDCDKIEIRSIVLMISNVIICVFCEKSIWLWDAQFYSAFFSFFFWNNYEKFLCLSQKNEKSGTRIVIIIKTEWSIISKVYYLNVAFQVLFISNSHCVGDALSFFFFFFVVWKRPLFVVGNVT